MANTLKATWRRVARHDLLKRSSHAVAAIDGEPFVFGGELVAREPRDGYVHSVGVITNSQTAPKTLSSSSKESPTPRVGASMVAVNETLYIFSGRGGTSMSAISENGGVWSFAPATTTWSLILPADLSAPSPEARSYHSATTDGKSKIFIHAGCPASGRLRDLWSFDIKSRVWTQLPDAPGPERGGTSLCFAAGKLWRTGGFDGKKEIGGTVDKFDLGSDKWESITFPADGSSGPGPRSVAALVPLTVAGKVYLFTVFGEADPSNLGHAGAGKMLGDVWAFEIEKQVWLKVDTEDSSDGHPASRGWFDAAAVSDGVLAVVGGLGEDNERLDDAWALEFE